MKMVKKYISANDAKIGLNSFRGRSIISLLGLAIALVSAGCANVSYTRLLTVEQEKASTGIPYFDTSPYILVQKDTNAAWQTTVLYLPDHTKMNTIDVCTFLAANNSTFTFTNAILSDSSVTSDSSAVPAAVVQAAATVGAAIAKMAGPSEVPRPASAYLFKIVRVNHQWGLVGASAADIDTLKPTEGL
jgi:hypothetical protein